MTASQGFELHPEAAQDIIEIWEYIALDNIRAASRMREQIFDAIQTLVRFPRMGTTRSELTSRPLRFQVLREYLIAYEAEAKPLLVVGVLHSRRSPRIIAAMLRERE